MRQNLHVRKVTRCATKITCSQGVSVAGSRLLRTTALASSENGLPTTYICLEYTLQLCACPPSYMSVRIAARWHLQC